MDETTSSRSTVDTADTSQPLPLTFGKWRDACVKHASHPSNKEKIRSQATQIFAFLSKHTELLTPGNVVMKTRSSHNEALAQLIAELGPAFSEDSPYASRICALYCICGAVEGCAQAGLSNKITNLLGNFFLGQCGPLEPEDGDEEDTDELVRDAAVMCLSALVKAHVKETDSIEQCIRLHLDLSRKGVERRCASPEMDEMEYDHGYEFPSTSNNDIRGGLSTLPRSRRSLCFGLVRAAVDFVESARAFGESSSVTGDMASFASFASSCLHGESDPRCLLQLLRMLHALQRNMLPFFQTEIAVKFPILDLFDAVAPYYPIQFTPPPNDVHGITRQGLHDALMSVLCFTGYYKYAAKRDETMLNLTTGIFSERLLDTGDGSAPSTTEDRLEAISDLTALLFPESGSLCDQMTEHTVKELSTALIATHEEAASGALSGGEKGRQNKALADGCRNLVSKVAAALEVSRESALWDVFVRDTVRVWSPLLSSSPQSARGRSAVAYLACLAASGGPRTLSLCLESCLPPLIDIVSNERDDKEKVAAAAYAIGAFFSSFQVALDRGMKDGVELHPHPLEPFCAKTFRSLYDLMGINAKGSEQTVSSSNDDETSLQIAAIRAVDSVLTVTPAALLLDIDIDRMCALLDRLISLVEATDEMVIDGAYENDNTLELRKSAAVAIGAMLGKALADDEIDAQERLCVLVEKEKIRTHLRNYSYQKILTSSKSSPPSREEKESFRFDLMTLACACEMNQSAANKILAALTNALNDALKNKNTVDLESDIHLAKLLCFVIQNGGPEAITAFRSLSAPNASPIDLIGSLCSISPAAEKRAHETEAPEKDRVMRVSALMLPPTSEDKEEVKNMVKRAHCILPYLMPACEYPFSQSQMLKLLEYVSHVLPPLNDWQNGQLSIALPILSVALSQGDSKLPDQEVDPTVYDSLQSIAPYLTDCALSPDVGQTARSAAASSLYQIITKYQKRNSAACLSRTILTDIVMPRILDSLDYAKTTNTEERGVTALSEALGVASVLGAAAAVRGGPSSRIADDVALFFVELSCDGKAEVPFVSGVKDIDFAVPSEATLRFASASAFGSMVSTEDGSPLWRQRILHLTSKHLIRSIEEQGNRADSAQQVLTCARLGRLLMSSFIVASGVVTSLGETTLSSIGDVILRDWSVIYTEETSAAETTKVLGSLMYSVKELALAAVVKLMAVAPKTVANNFSVVVPTLSQAYTDECSEDPMLALPCKVLALQGLRNATNYFEPFKRSMLSVKPAVLSVLLSAVDYPSKTLREAAVDARNAWFLLE